MKNIVSDRYKAIQKTPMGEIWDFINKYDDVINLSIGDPDIKTPEIIIDNMAADAKDGHTKYTDYRGYPELRVEIINYYKEEYDLKIADEEVFVSTGGCVSMYLVLQALLDPGDEVIIPDPYFTPYPSQVELAGGKAVMLPTYKEEKFQIDLVRLKKLVTKKTKAIILNTPNNPTGACLSEETLNKIADFCEQEDLFIVADDIYTAFSFHEKFIPIMGIKNMKERTITINSFSKNFIMTGFRVANIIGPKAIIDTIQMINENVVFTTPSISQRAALHALKLRKQIQMPIINEFKARVDYCISRINSIKNMDVIQDGGSFYVFPSIKDTGLTSSEVAKQIMNEAHVLVLPGDTFGKCGEGHIRISCTTEISKLKVAFDRIEKMKMFS